MFFESKENIEKQVAEYLRNTGQTVVTTWDRRFLEMATLTSSWSKDESTKCGAVIVDQKRRVVSLGYNGFPRGVLDDPVRLNNRDEKYRYVVHAELNAILAAPSSVAGCTIYVMPFPPCCDCAKAIIQSGIAKVVCPAEYPERWKESIEAAETMFGEAGVELVKVLA